MIQHTAVERSVSHDVRLRRRGAAAAEVTAGAGSDNRAEAAAASLTWKNSM
jgi:hypothetical protein